MTFGQSTGEKKKATVQSGIVKWTRARCPQCFSRESSAVELYSRPDAREPWQVVRCDDCGQQYTDPRPAHEDWEMYYPREYFAYKVRPKRHRWHTPLRRKLDQKLLQLYRGYPISRKQNTRHRILATLLSPIFSHLLDPYVLPLHGDGCLLDVGCGSGSYLSRMRSLGWEVLGVDRSSQAAQCARKEFGVPVVVGTVFAEELPEKSFDLVTAWQALEHVDCPRQTLSRIRTLLRPGGRLTLAVPNQEGWASRFFGPAWVGLDLPRHLSHFSADSLELMLKTEGFEVLHRSTLGQSGWIRHSARRAALFGQTMRQYPFVSKALSRAASSLAVRRGMGEALFVVAQSK